MAPACIANRKWRSAHPETWRKARERSKKSYREKGSTNKRNHGQQWTMSEDTRITDPNRPGDLILAQELGRTVQAIQVHRHNLKKESES